MDGLGTITSDKTMLQSAIREGYSDAMQREDLAEFFEQCVHSVNSGSEESTIA